MSWYFCFQFKGARKKKAEKRSIKTRHIYFKIKATYIDAIYIIKSCFHDLKTEKLNFWQSNKDDEREIVLDSNFIPLRMY
jgi:hypothetical protein